MLRTKLLQGFALVVVILGLLSALFARQIIQKQVVDEAQKQVRLDLGSAWALFDNQIHEIDTILRMVAIKKAVVDSAADKLWDSADLQQRIELIQQTFGLDFLTMVSPEGQVVLRTMPPHNTGDSQVHNPLVRQALKGEDVSGVAILTGSDLEKEGGDLAERAFLALEDTPRARPTSRRAEDRGMVLMGAVPILRGPQLIGVIYGGILVNRGTAVVDRIVDTIFKNEMYRESPIGTATVFLHDVRVATTVRLGNGNRAIGTRASKEVADRVLDNGTPWVGPAFVVQESYLTAYDPIRDVEGRVIGMLYVGRLERPFRDLQRTIMLRYLGLSVLGLGATMLLAIFLAGRLARPIHALAEAAHCMHRGDQHKPVAEHSSCDEIENLIAEFNEMAGALEERQTRLAEANRELAAKSAALSNLNRSYMDMLGFVSHELKSPVASMLNYSFLLKGGTLGPLTPRQQKAIQSIEAGTHRLSEMVRHYLNLSRIENDEMKPQPTRVAVLDDIVRPVLDTYAADIDGRQMRVENSIGAEVAVQADSSMVSEIFENLVSNAIKYGRDGGRVALTCREAGERYEFSVGNEGKGISAEHKDQLFEKFSRLNGGSQRVKGTGLGLFITKRIVEAHGGRIEVQSTPGQWTEFRFSLPKAPA